MYLNIKLAKNFRVARFSSWWVYNQSLQFFTDTVNKTETYSFNVAHNWKSSWNTLQYSCRILMHVKLSPCQGISSLPLTSLVTMLRNVIRTSLNSTHLRARLVMICLFALWYQNGYRNWNPSSKRNTHQHERPTDQINKKEIRYQTTRYPLSR